METLTVNLTGTLRKVRKSGGEYIVVPLSMIVPGVMNGSAGPLLYQLEDIEASYKGWNDIPIVLNHPYAADGSPMSGRDPEVWNDYGLGRVHNARVDGKLIAEGWFEVERVRRVSPSLLSRLESGQVIELSTGLDLDQEPAQGVHNGVQYVGIARRYRPDHLAILPNSKGACSTERGCGVNVNELALAHVVSTNSTGVFSKMFTEQERTEIINGLITNCDCGWTEADRPTLNAMDEALLSKCRDMMKAKVANSKPVADDSKVAELQVANQSLEAKVTELTSKLEAATKPKTITINDLPVEVQEQLAFGREAMDRERAELTERLVANAVDKDAARKTAAEIPLKTLRTLAPVNTEPVSNGAQTFWGAGAGQVVSNAKAGTTPLGVPTLSFED